MVLKHPALYRQGRDNLDMNVSQVLQWLGYAVVHSLLVFWLPYASFSLKDTAWEPRTGYSQGIDVRGLAIFCAMTWAMQLSVSWSTLTWTRWNWGVIAFSQSVTERIAERQRVQHCQQPRHTQRQCLRVHLDKSYQHGYWSVHRLYQPFFQRH